MILAVDVLFVDVYIYVGYSILIYESLIY